MERKLKYNKIRTIARSYDHGTVDQRYVAFSLYCAHHTYHVRTVRTLYSKIIVALVDNIRNHCERFITLNGGLVLQVNVPYPKEAPSRLTNDGDGEIFSRPVITKGIRASYGCMIYK